MATKNDERIIKLKEIIEKKREELNNMHSRFAPKTNCILQLDGETYNLNVSTQNLTYLLVKINALIQSAELLNMSAEEVTISGFSLADWFDDIKSKKDSIDYRDKKRELTTIENKLNGLLSSDKQTELQIDSLEALLK